MDEPTSAKPKHQVLQELTRILFDLDPMGIRSEELDTYEPEALSILSRYTEMSLQLADEQGAVDAAAGVVHQTFEFWFENVKGADLEQVSLQTLKAYLESYPMATPEQLVALGIDATQVPQQETELKFVPMEDVDPPKRPASDKPGVQKITIG